MASLLWFLHEVRCGGTAQPAREAHALLKFVFIRVNSWLEYAKQILWSSPVAAFAAGHDMC
jgi:hypothetical protein